MSASLGTLAAAIALWLSFPTFGHVESQKPSRLTAATKAQAANKSQSGASGWVFTKLDENYKKISLAGKYISDNLEDIPSLEAWCTAGRMTQGSKNAVVNNFWAQVEIKTSARRDKKLAKDGGTILWGSSVNIQLDGQTSTSVWLINDNQVGGNPVVSLTIAPHESDGSVYSGDFEHDLKLDKQTDTRQRA